MVTSRYLITGYQFMLTHVKVLANFQLWALLSRDTIKSNPFDLKTFGSFILCYPNQCLNPRMKKIKIRKQFLRGVEAIYSIRKLYKDFWKMREPQGRLVFAKLPRRTLKSGPFLTYTAFESYGTDYRGRKPLPLTTVELQKAGSRLLRIGPKKTLDVCNPLILEGMR
jgi:hypothetical protein